MENPNFIVQLFIRTLQIKHKLTFQKEKEEYFRVLFDTYLNGQGNPTQLKDYISAGIDNQQTINIIADQVIEWQGKAEELKAAETAQKNQKELQKQKIQEFVASRTKKLREQAQQEKKERKQRKQKGEQPPRKKIKPIRQKVEVDQAKAPQPQGQVAQHHNTEQPDNPQDNSQGQQQQHPRVQDNKSLKYELQNQGKQKCKFYPFCKNLENCQYFHPTQRCTYFPHCRYGDGCLYEHEACKFKEKCNKPNCGYAHPFKKTDPFQQMMKSLMSQHNPLHTGAKVFKKKPNPKYNKQQGNEEQK